MLTVDVIREAGSEPADLVSVEIRAANEEAGSEPLVARKESSITKAKPC